MLTTIEAEIDVNGNVRLLEPIKVTKTSRAIVTLLENENLSVKKQRMSEEEARVAEERFARWMGSVNSGNPRSADNEQIDIDLAREYGATHDDE